MPNMGCVCIEIQISCWAEDKRLALYVAVAGFAPTSPRKQKRKMEDRMMLAALNYCRELLHIKGFLTDAENDKIHTRIKKFQDKKQIGISEAQLMSMELKYDDNAKDE